MTSFAAPQPELDDESAGVTEGTVRDVDEPELLLDCLYCGHELDEDGFCSTCGATALTRPEPR